MKVYTSVAEIVGRTPLMEVCNIERELNLKAKIFVKLEFLNPGGSIKDRVALQMINDAIKDGKINKDTTIIEPTSGNTGIGLCAIGCAMGLKTIICMPETMSEERRKTMRAYGAKLELTDGSLGMKGAIKRANELASEIENSFIPSQFDNKSNPKAHLLSTGPEIWNDTEGNLDAFVSGVGTGGTITGIGQFLKDKNEKIKVIAVEPATSAVLSGKAAGKHDLQGIGAGFVPSILDTTIYDEIVTISDNEAYESARLICQKEGLMVGITSGANLCAAIKLAQRKEFEGKTIVTVLPDTGARYLSTKLFEM